MKIIDSKSLGEAIRIRIQIIISKMFHCFMTKN